MQADELKLQELVDFSEGFVGLKGRRLVIHDMHAFGQFRKDLRQLVGQEQARRVLTRFGYFWGEADAAAMKRIFDWDNEIELLRAGPKLHSMQGVVKAQIKELEYTPSSHKFSMELLWQDSGEAMERIDAIGPSDHPVCWMQIGYASGYASYCTGQKIYFIENKCIAKGDPVCTATGKDEASWGQEIVPYLTYFQADDIESKIDELTRQLKEKDRQLARHRRLLADGRKTTSPDFMEIRSPAFARVVEFATRVASYDSSVLITGESGTGKEVIARYIHKCSSRAEKPFLAVNCGALPETLLESELFGHAAGAFTGAIRDRTGLFEQASGGTIFLDEIGKISTNMQVKLLRVLQEREIYRVGESTPRKVNVRIIAATNRNPKHAIQTGQFREDLYYRLGVVEIEMPPLRLRKEDILILARHFVSRFSQKLKMANLRLDTSCLDYLLEYNWPGNVRELENAIERAAVMSKNGLILPESLPPALLGKARAMQSNGDPLTKSMADIERQHITSVLELVNGNRTRAVEILKISPATLWRKLKEFRIQ